MSPKKNMPPKKDKKDGEKKSDDKKSGEKIKSGRVAKPSRHELNNPKQTHNRKLTAVNSGFESLTESDPLCPNTHGNSRLSGGPLALRPGTKLNRLRSRTQDSSLRQGLAIQSLGVNARKPCRRCRQGLGPFQYCRAWRAFGEKCGNCSVDRGNCQNGQFTELVLPVNSRTRRRKDEEEEIVEESSTEEEWEEESSGDSDDSDDDFNPPSTGSGGKGGKGGRGGNTGGGAATQPILVV